MRRIALVLATVLGVGASAHAADPVTLSAADDVKVFGTFWRAENAGAVSSPVHQAGSSAAEYARARRALVAAGFTVLAIDQRSGNRKFGPNRTADAFGREATYDDALPDLEAALAWGRDEAKGAPVVVLGSSYSAALVFVLAAAHPGEIAAVVAFSPGDICDAARSRARPPSNRAVVVDQARAPKNRAASAAVLKARARQRQDRFVAKTNVGAWRVDLRSDATHRVAEAPGHAARLSRSRRGPSLRRMPAHTRRTGMTTPVPSETQCCIAGGGPGRDDARLPARRAGVRTIVSRSTATSCATSAATPCNRRRCAWIGRARPARHFLERPHQRPTSSAAGRQGARAARRLPRAARALCFVALMPQWEFLDFSPPRAPGRLALRMTPSHCAGGGRRPHRRRPRHVARRRLRDPRRLHRRLRRSTLDRARCRRPGRRGRRRTHRRPLVPCRPRSGRDRQQPGAHRARPLRRHHRPRRLLAVRLRHRQGRRRGRQARRIASFRAQDRRAPILAAHIDDVARGTTSATHRQRRPVDAVVEAGALCWRRRNAMSRSAASVSTRDPGRVARQPAAESSVRNRSTPTISTPCAGAGSGRTGDADGEVAIQKHVLVPALSGADGELHVPLRSRHQAVSPPARRRPRPRMGVRPGARALAGGLAERQRKAFETRAKRMLTIPRSVDTVTRRRLAASPPMRTART